MRDLLYSCFFFFMPFTQALTFNVGFPLKFSELSLFLLGLTYLLFNKKILLPKKLILLVSALFFMITISVIVNLFWKYPYPLREYESRFGYTGDAIAKYIYFGLALLSFFISVDIFLTDRKKYTAIWIYGSLAAAAYSWYLVIFSALKMHVYLLPGMIDPPQTINGTIIRCGTFLEGNIMGLYLVLSAALCLYVKKIKYGIFLLISVITTFSTLSIISAFVLTFIYLQHKIFQRKNLGWGFAGIVLLAAGLFFFSQTSLYKMYVHDKLFARTDRITTEAGLSKLDRLYTFESAYNTALANPVLGVGLSNFSRHYDKYLPATNDAGIRNFMMKKNSKVIPNNIYVELWAENGIVALLVFLAFLGLLLLYAREDRSKALLGGLVCMMLCFFAYPTFTMIYLWAFMAAPVAGYISHKVETE